MSIFFLILPHGVLFFTTAIFIVTAFIFTTKCCSNPGLMKPLNIMGIISQALTSLFQLLSSPLNDCYPSNKNIRGYKEQFISLTLLIFFVVHSDYKLEHIISSSDFITYCVEHLYMTEWLKHAVNIYLNLFLVSLLCRHG